MARFRLIAGLGVMLVALWIGGEPLKALLEKDMRLADWKRKSAEV